MPERTGASKRDAQRAETRLRVYEAAVGEFRRVGVDAAELGAITAAAGVARGTFYVHFASKEHVLRELVHHEEEWMAEQLSATLPRAATVREGLGSIVELCAQAEARLGSVLFRDVMSAHFSTTDGGDDDWHRHPVIVHVVEWLKIAQKEGMVLPAVNATATAISILLGSYALLVNDRGSKSLPAGVLDGFLSTMTRGVATR